MREENIDAMKHRKSTHLAGVDVDMMENKIVTIKNCYYDTNVNVSGSKTNGYFLVFEEPIKDMLVNSTNRKTIYEIVQKQKKLSMKDARNIGNWAGVKIELYFDESVRMMGKVTGGIRVRKDAPKLPNLTPDTPEWAKVVTALSKGYTIEQIKTKYTISNENEKLLSNG